MSLPALFALIFATLLGLLPIFLLVGRRAIASRLSRRRGESGGGPGTGGTTTPEAERTVPGRVPNGSRRSKESPTRLTVSGTGDPAGESAILERLIRERRMPGASAPGAQRIRMSAQREDARFTNAANDANDNRSSIEARLGKLSELQRAVVYREVLGPPLSLRAPEERERY